MKIKLCITGINDVLNFFYCNNISQYYCIFCVFDQINVGLIDEHKILLSKTFKINSK